MIYQFSNSERAKITNGYKYGVTINKLAQKFGCSGTPIGKVLIEELGLENYKKIAKEHSRKNSQKSIKKAQEASSQKRKIIFSESEKIEMWRLFKEDGMGAIQIGEKFGCSRGPIVGMFILEHPDEYKNIAEKHCKQNKNYISSWEDKFYDEYLFPIFRDCDLRRQYYIIGLKHVFDFAIVECNILIEVDGGRWHGHSGNPEQDNEALKKMAKINEFVKKSCWKLYRYNDEDLRKLGIIK